MANPDEKQMLRDANGDLIPQYWDVYLEEFQPLTGSNGANDMRLGGYEEIRGLSTDTKPINLVIGSIFYEMDTTEVYMWTGFEWVVQD